MRHSLRGIFLGGTLILASWAPAHLAAANRIYLENQTANVGDTSVTVLVRAETDQERHGYSLSIKYDQSLINVTSVTTAGTAAESAEWSNGRIVAAQGAIQWGVAMDISEPLTNTLPVGNNLVLLVLKVDVVATSPAVAAVAPQDKLGVPEGGWLNLFSTRGVNTVPVLSGASITIQSNVAGNRYQLGDCNGDKKEIPDLSDAIYLLTFMFLGGTAPICAASCDANSDAANDLSDAVYLLTYLFLGGTKPADPYPACATAPAESCAADICGL